MGLFKSTVSKIKKGLDKTRDALTGSLRSLLVGRTLDDAVIDDIETTNISALEKITENVISHFEEKNGIEAEDCGWFVPFLKNKMMVEEQVKKIFSQRIVQQSLVNPDVNASFDEYLEDSKIFNKSGVGLW